MKEDPKQAAQVFAHSRSITLGEVCITLGEVCITLGKACITQGEVCMYHTG